MFADDTKVWPIPSVPRYERAVLDHLCNPATEITDAWCRRLTVLTTQMASSEAAPVLRPSSDPVNLRVEAAVALAKWLSSTAMWTQSEVAAYLNDLGESTTRGRLWSQGNLNRYLTGRAAPR